MRGEPAVSIQQMYQDTLAKIEQVLHSPDIELPKKYGRITDLLLQSRVDYLRQVLLSQVGEAVVQSGPFKGMRFHTHATEGCYIPKLLGCYEEELHPLLESIARQNPYDRIINVGCAEGYYAVGLARCLPNAKILAFDINPKAQEYCKSLAAMNGVSDQVLVGGKVSVEDWPGLIDGRVLIVSDCEGAEYDLLDPNKSRQVLKQADFLIELHHANTQPLLVENLLAQYKDSHDIQLIGHGSRNPSRFTSLQTIKHLDQLLAVWEFRGGPTPWVFMKVKE
jgi:hypothetical protein